LRTAGARTLIATREDLGPMGTARPFEIGDMVEHRVFGEGLIIKTEGEGLSTSVVVRFSSDGKQRKLRVKQARLKRKVE
jgi:hypothetical protein